MKLYWGPHTCAIGIHALLEEADAPYEIETVDVQGGATHEQPFKTVNPKSKVPVLMRDDGETLTEFGTIARWLARTYPDALLASPDAEADARATELMDYAIGTVHGQAFARIFFPGRFAKDKAHEAEVKADGKAMAKDGFAILGQGLGDRPYAAGDAFTYADAALFYVEWWGTMLKIEMPPNIEAHFEAVKARPSFQAALAKQKAA